MSGPILLDTGPLVAILSASDQHHKVCIACLNGIKVPLLTCWPVITEAAWLLRTYPHAVELLLSSFNHRLFDLASLEAADLPGIATILGRYRNLGLQLADASLAHLANREGIDTIFTLDRRDFAVVRLARGKKFHIVP